MKYKRIKIKGEFKGYNIGAIGDVINTSNVLNLKIKLLDNLLTCELPDREMQDIIEEEVIEEIINKAYCPEIEF